MAEPLEALDAVAIGRRLQVEGGLTLTAKFEIRTVAETGSTNDDVLDLGDNGAGEGLVLFAESQTAGRGRRGDTWVSPPGVNLLFSILLRPETPAGSWMRIPHLAAVAISRGIEQAVPELPEPIQLKWPNDLFLGGRKAGGILIESRPPCVVLGVGINVNLEARSLPEELRPIATSVGEQAGRILSRNDIAASILAEWGGVYPGALIDFDPILGEIESRSLLRKRRVSVKTGGSEIVGRVTGFGPDGELIVAEAGSESLTEIRSADLVRLISA